MAKEALQPRVERGPENFEFTLHNLPPISTGGVAFHETLHFAIDPLNVDRISARPIGDNILGYTLVRRMDTITLAAGIVHGQGYGHDKAMLIAIAGEQSVPSAIYGAQTRINSYKPGVLELFARALEAKGTLSGEEARKVLRQAIAEVEYVEKHHNLPMASSSEEFMIDDSEETQIETIDDLYNSVPKQGKYDLIINTDEGYRVEKFKDGIIVEEEEWILVEDKEGNKKYVKKSEQFDFPSLPKSQDIFVFEPEVVEEKISGRIFLFPTPVSEQRKKSA